MIMRKPLYLIEKDAQPITVCVTGGTGIASDTETGLAYCVQHLLYAVEHHSEASLVSHVNVQ